VIVTFDDLFADIKGIIPIVDDSPIVLAKLSDDLAGQYGLITAASGEEIVKILKALPTPVGAFSFLLNSASPPSPRKSPQDRTWAGLFDCLSTKPANGYISTTTTKNTQFYVQKGGPP
jgi:hypothetical protein